MHLDFAKLDGLGNDFIMIDNMDGKIELSSEQVIALCDRHFGIGADGVILVEPPRTDDTDAFMNYINSDGTLAQMCGNGVRCFAKFLVDRNILHTEGETLVAGTLAGPKNIKYKTEDGLLTKAEVNMGKPILDPESIPTTLSADGNAPCGAKFVYDDFLESPWGPFAFTAVSMGNPHAICFIENWGSLPDEIFTTDVKSLATLNLDLIGPFFENNPAFPEKANIEFAEVLPNGIHMRVYERGCGETLACGTGACATSVAATLTGRSGCRNDVHLLGGTLNINWQDDGCVIMTGPAEQTFIGSVDIV